MVQQFLQTALEFLKEVWFQLNSRLGLENTEAFIFLKGHLLQIQGNLRYMGISIVALFLVSFTIYKIRSNSKEREQKLYGLLEEIKDEEEYDEGNPKRFLQPESELDDNNDLENFLFASGESTSPSYMEDIIDDERIVLEKDLEAELDVFKPETAETTSNNKESSDIETIIELVNPLLTKNEFDKKLNKFMKERFDTNKGEKNVDKNIDLNLVNYSSHDQTIKGLHEENELTGLDDNLSSDAPLTNHSELDEDEQKKVISGLCDEMEHSNNQLIPQVEEPSQLRNTIDNSSQIHIDGDNTAEIPASLETELEATKLDTTSDGILDTHDYQPDTPSLIFKPEADIVQSKLDIEPKITSENLTFEREPIEDAAELESKPSSLANESDYSSPEKTDGLIDRLKFLQERLENLYQPPEPKRSSASIEKKTSNSEAESLAEPRRYTRLSTSVRLDSKKHMDLLESFVFLKDQKKHK